MAIAGFLTGALLGVHLADRPRVWLRTAFAAQAVTLAAVVVLGAVDVLVYTGHRALITVAVLALSFGLQNATVRRLAAPDLTTTVLTLTLTGLAADSVLAGGSGARLPRRLGSVLADAGRRAVGALLLQVCAPTWVIALAAVLVVIATVLLAGTPDDKVAR